MDSRDKPKHESAQTQFLDVVTRDEATARFRAHLKLEPLGTDFAGGQPVLRAATLLTSREIGVLAAIGLAEVAVFRRPRVAIFSTGNEIVAPGQPRRTGAVYDSNAAIIGAAVEELGGEPVHL